MGRKTSAPGAEDIIRFYDARGYRNSVGSGQRPAIVVVDFSNAFTRGASQFPGGDFANEMAQTGRLLTVARELGLPVFFTTIAYADPEKESGLWGRRSLGSAAASSAVTRSLSILSSAPAPTRQSSSSGFPLRFSRPTCKIGFTR